MGHRKSHAWTESKFHKSTKRLGCRRGACGLWGSLIGTSCVIIRNPKQERGETPLYDLRVGGNQCGSITNGFMNNGRFVVPGFDLFGQAYKRVLLSGIIR